MKPHETKNDNLGNLKKGISFVRQQQEFYRSREAKIKKFDNLDLYEKMNLYYKHKRQKHLCFIRDIDKIEIVDKYLS